MNIGPRRVSPLKLTGVGGAVIIALIGLGLHPPSGRVEHQARPPDVSVRGITEAPTPLDDALPSSAVSESVSARGSGPTRTAGGTHSAGAGRGANAATGNAATGNKAPGSTRTRGGGGAQGGSGGSKSGGGAQTVNCPSVEPRLPAVPVAAAAEVNQNLALLKQQIADADARLAELAAAPVNDPNFIQNTVLGPLRDNRIATLDRIAIAIGRYGTRPSNLDELAPCTLNG
jgi:hypothetical protein